MKPLLWLYGIVSALYFGLYVARVEIVTRYAVGPLWLMMMVGVIVLGLLIALQFFDSSQDNHPAKVS